MKLPTFFMCVPWHMNKFHGDPDFAGFYFERDLKNEVQSPSSGSNASSNIRERGQAHNFCECVQDRDSAMSSNTIFHSGAVFHIF